MNRRDFLLAASALGAVAIIPADGIASEPQCYKTRELIQYHTVKGIEAWGTSITESKFGTADVFRKDVLLMRLAVNCMGGYVRWSPGPMEAFVFLNNEIPAVKCSEDVECGIVLYDWQNKSHKLITSWGNTP